MTDESKGKKKKLFYTPIAFLILWQQKKIVKVKELRDSEVKSDEFSQDISRVLL